MSDNILNKSFKELTKEWTSTVDLKYLYRDKKIDDRGMDYEKFIKLRFHSINKNHIAEIYGIDGWYIIWYLMLEGKNNKGCYVKTTINMINQDIENIITNDNIKKILISLHKGGIIKLNKSRIKNVNTPIEIFIPYGDDKYYQFKDDKWTGYKALPYDYVKVALNKFTPEEWAVFSVLCVRWNDYYTHPVPDRATGEIIYIPYYNHYAYPTNEDIGDRIGRSSSAVNRYIQSLRLKKTLIEIIENKKENMMPNYSKEIEEFEGNKAKNLIYKIELFDRVEYIYHHVISKDDRPEKERQYNINHFDSMIITERYKELKKYDYYMRFYTNTINKFKDCYTQKDIDTYIEMNKIFNPLNKETLEMNSEIA